MDFDTKTMRAEIDAAPGDAMRVDKDDLRFLLDAVESGQTAAEQLIRMRDGLASLAAAA